jgi:hypothetical protein
VSEYSIKTCNIQAGWFSSIPQSRKIIFAHNGPYTQHGLLPVSLNIYILRMKNINSTIFAVPLI